MGILSGKTKGVFTLTEHDIQSAIREELSKRGFCVFRANVGKVKMQDGRWFDTGLPKGHSDLVAYKNGRAYFLEVKTPTGHIRPEQEKFLAIMRDRYGCVTGIVRSVDDALEVVGVIS